jgi:DNA topoisomerase-1
MKLLIVESPGKIKKIRSFLGADWQVAASVGHIRDLPKKDMGIKIEDGKVQIQYINSGDKAQTIKSLQTVSKQAQEIYLAMDMDREGEAIAWHVGLVLGKDNWGKIKRVTFTEITKNAILKAIEKPRRVDANLVNAQQARRAVDRLVGFKVSPLVWQAKDAGTSAGRVQSVAVRLVVEREREIRNFKVQNYWRIKANNWIKSKENNFWSELVVYEGKNLVTNIETGKEDKQFTISSQEKADSLIEEFKSGEWKVIGESKEIQSKNPYAPYVTSTLQQTASVRLKWNSQKTMKVAQQLYENSAITYMRTDSPAISKEAVEMARKYISQNFPKEYLPAKAHSYKAKGGNAQEAHECIRPTNVNDTPEALTNLSSEEKQLYSLIWKQFVACQMAAARFNVAVIDIENGKGLFKATGRQMLFDGWTKLTGSISQSTKDKDGGDQEEEEDAALLPEVKKGDKLNLNEIKSTQHKTKPPSRYTEATLIRTLEKFGIGRPSTYASIMENIKRRGYVKEDKRKFLAEAVGERLVDLLTKTFPDSWMDYRFTAEMEDELDKVAEGNANWNEVVIAFNQQLDSKLKSAPKIVPKGAFPCDKCGHPMVERKSKHGPFLGCSNYPNCKNIKPLNRPLNEETPKVEEKPVKTRKRKTKEV